MCTQVHCMERISRAEHNEDEPKQSSIVLWVKEIEFRLLVGQSGWVFRTESWRGWYRHRERVLENLHRGPVKSSTKCWSAHACKKSIKCKENTTRKKQAEEFLDHTHKNSLCSHHQTWKDLLTNGHRLEVESAEGTGVGKNSSKTTQVTKP